MQLEVQCYYNYMSLIYDYKIFFCNQVLEPLRAVITGSPLEEARHLAQRYSRMRQEAETQVLQILFFFGLRDGIRNFDKICFSLFIISQLF